MPSVTQANRWVKVYSALPEDTLLFSSLSGSETLSTLYEYNLVLFSENHSLDLNQLLGTDISITVEPREAGADLRIYHGFVSSCSHVGSDERLSTYEFTLRPWLWFLTRTADCKIFQDISVPDIIKQVLQEQNFSDIDDRLTESYSNWNYCVQYRETDFNFVSRLMEQEGIYFYFKHELGSHKLILCDGYAAHEKNTQYESVPYYPHVDYTNQERDHLSEWNLQKALQPGNYVSLDYNFEDPGANLLVRNSVLGEYANSDYEVYDYPGEYLNRSDGESYIAKRMEELAVQHEYAFADGNVQGLLTGNLFSIDNHPRDDQNQEYLIVESTSTLHMYDYVSGGSESDSEFSCSIRVIPSRQQYRAPRTTPKPLVQGPQTAKVVGPNSEEIWTDEFGRVKLQFHWDRYGDSNENSSCWVRVSQVWAGQGWGSMHIPRIGHEVIVEFLEGDPDRPIVTGRVYNGDNDVPYDLPSNATQSGVKSRSSKTGNEDNFNEIRMEDKKGEEELYIHAEKDQNNVIENNESTSVGVNRSESVGADESVSIGAKKTITVGDTHTETIENDTNITISTGDYSQKVNTGTTTYYSKGAVTENFDATQSTTVAQDVTVTSTDAKIKLEAATQIVLHTGQSSIELNSDGTIKISGANIEISATKTVTAGVGTQQVTLDAAKIQSSGAAIQTTAVGTHEITGALVKIN